VDLEAAKKMQQQTPPLAWPHNERGHAMRVGPSVERLKQYTTPMERFHSVGDRIMRLCESENRYRADYPYPNTTNTFQVWDRLGETEPNFFVEAIYDFRNGRDLASAELLAVEAYWYHPKTDDEAQYKKSGRTTQPLAIEYVDISDIYKDRAAAMTELALIELSVAEIERRFTKEKGILFTKQQQFKELDTKRPIEGTFTITTIPEGVAPKHVREQWVGLEVPIRFLTPHMLSGEGDVEMTTADIIVSLQSQGKQESADWFWKYAKQHKLTLFYDVWDSWKFDVSEGTIQTIKPTTSIDYYNQKFAAIAKNK
jgi:hypothetical protein